MSNFLPFPTSHSIFRKDPYVRNVDTDTKLFVMLGSLTHMIPFVLGLSSMSLLDYSRKSSKKCDQSFFLVSSFCTILPFTFFLCTFAVLKMCFESRRGIIFELGHCFFTGSGSDAFAWMASSSYTAMLLIGYLISVVSFKSTPSSSSSSEDNNTHDAKYSNLPKIATFFFITFVLLHFVGVPMWKDYTGPLLRSHGSIGFTTSLPMLASVTHSAAFACGLAFVWYRKFGSVRGVSLLVMYDEN